MKKKVQGGLLATAGFLLSPLSWWNDLIINIPLAYAFGFVFGLISPVLFAPMMVFGYWLSNIAGFLLMHYGVQTGFSKEKKKQTPLWRYFALSIVYTGVVFVLVQTGNLTFPALTA